MLLETLKRHWWVPVLRGVAAIIFGVMAFAYPGLTVAVLIMLFGAWVLVDGVFRVIGAVGFSPPVLNCSMSPGNLEESCATGKLRGTMRVITD